MAETFTLTPNEVCARCIELEAQRDDYLNREWRAERARREEARRLDFIKPGFRVLAGDHMVQVWWHVKVDGKTEARSVVVPIDTPNAVRAAIDLAMQESQ